jgi:uncharacterized protein (DUF111 family)
MTALNHVHWDCSSGISTPLMLGACLDVCSDEIKAKLGEGVEKSFGDIFPRNSIKSHCIQTALGKAVACDKTMFGLVSSQALYNVVSDASSMSGTIGLLPSVIGSLQEAELIVTDYTISFQLELQTLFEIVCILLILDYLEVNAVSCGPIPMGEGYIEIDDCVLPVPSPATLHLMLGLRTSPGPRGITDDIVTSSACALLRQLTMQDGIQRLRPSVFVPMKTGLGTQKHGSKTVRLILGTNEAEQAVTAAVSGTEILWNSDTLNCLVANLDDATAEELALGVENLLQMGAIDAWVTPIVMKKGRAAHTLHCLCHASEESTNKLLGAIFRQTTTLGVRIHRNLERAALRRSFVSVQTSFVDQVRQGNVDVKIGYLGDEIVSVKPEFDHCRAISVATGVPFRRIAEVAIEEFYKRDAEL